MRNFFRLGLGAAVSGALLIISACNNGSGNPPPLPTVALTVTPTTVTTGGTATLTWSSTNASSSGCTASGAWNGPQASSGSLTLTPASYGILTYTLTCTGPGGSATASATLAYNQILPTGQSISPTAAPGAVLLPLNPGLASDSNYQLAQAMTEAVSPDQNTLLILTSGYNDLYDSTGTSLITSDEYVFVYDVSAGSPVQKQALPLPNAFGGITFAPDGQHFYVAGGVDDVVRVYAQTNGQWSEVTASGNSPVPIPLNHLAPPSAALGVVQNGNGIAQYAVATGLAVSADGTHLVVDNFYNDSISLIDLTTNTKVSELDLRPGKDGGSSGTPGGESPFGVVIVGNKIAYISSERDREIDVVDISNAAAPTLVSRIPVAGNPNKMVLNKAQTTLYAAMDNADAVAVIDVASNAVTGNILTVAPAGSLALKTQYRGAAPNGLSLSPDNSTLYVSNGGTNSVAVISLAGTPAVTGLIPTGWYPQDVALSQNGTMLHVINSRSVPGPNTGNCFGYSSPCLPDSPVTYQANQYIYELEKAGLLSAPVPTGSALATLTKQVIANNNYGYVESSTDMATMAALKQNIKHIIYIVRENRTYDQILGDLPVGNGDPGLVEFGSATTPNIHALASQTVTFDNFYDPAEVSGDGWPWSMSARETDVGVKTIPLDYAYTTDPAGGHTRGVPYDVEGANRNINVGINSHAARLAANPTQAAIPALEDPDLLPGTNNDAAPDGPDGEVQQGYLWNAAIRAGLTVRNYGYFCDLTRYNEPAPFYLKPDLNAYADSAQQAYPANPELQNITDIYFRGFDNVYPDYYREQEWEREFNQYVANKNLPSLSMVRLMHDHTSGNVTSTAYTKALAGVTTPESQVADNDYSIGLLLQALAKSPYANSTLVFIVEDDAQDGPDHVDAHRSVAFIAGPYVKAGALVSDRYTTVNMLRTMEDILGIDHMSIYDAYEGPMTDAFDLTKTTWTFTAQFPAILASTQLPQPAGSTTLASASVKPLHEARWWTQHTRGMNFAVPDKLDAAAYNRVLWEGIKGKLPYPVNRSGTDLRKNRERLLQQAGISAIHVASTSPGEK